MIKGLLFVATAALVAAVPLIGHWMAEPPARATQISSVAVRHHSSGTPWMPILLAVIVAAIVVGIVLAVRRTRAIRVLESTPLEQKPAPARRWHVILEAIGSDGARTELRRGPLEHLGATHLEVAQAVERRWDEVHGTPDGVRLRARVTPLLENSDSDDRAYAA